MSMTRQQFERWLIRYLSAEAATLADRLASECHTLVACGYDYEELRIQLPDADSAYVVPASMLSPPAAGSE